MLATYQRFGVIDVAGTVVLALVHAGLSLAYLLGLARGVYAVTPGRVSVVSYIDGFGPAWQVGFGVTALGLLAAVRWTRWLPLAHSGAAFVLAVYTSALWAGVVLSASAPSVVTSIAFTGLLLWHVVLVTTYSAALAPGARRARHRGESSG